MKRLLFISPKPPYPLSDGGRIRIFQSLYLLSKFFDVDVLYLHEGEKIDIVNKGIGKYVINIFCFNMPKYKQILNAARSLFNQNPIRNNMLYCRKIQDWIDRHIENYEVVFCQTLRVAEYVKKHSEVRKYVDFVDAVSMNYGIARFKTSFLRSLYYNIDFRRISRYEDCVVDIFDKCSIISPIDKDYIEQRNGKPISNLFVVGNMVKVTGQVVIPSKAQRNILFVGKMSYEPNILAVTNFVRNVLPNILMIFPDVMFYIVGASPVERVRKLSNDHVVVTGFVEDLFDYYSKASVVVAPMLSGAGIQNKIIQAMALGCCVLTTSIGAEGLDEQCGGLVVRNGNEEISNAITKLLAQPILRDETGRKAREYILSTMTEDVIIEEFKQFFT